MTHRPSFAAALILTLGSCRTVSNATPYHILVARSQELATGHLSAFTQTERTLSRPPGDTAEHESVTARIDEWIQPDAAGPVFVRVTTGHYAGGDYYDSTFMRRSDLRPIREHMAYIQRRLEKRFDFKGNVVHQTNIVGDSTTTFTKEYLLPMYGFSEIETIIRSLPFRPGYSAILPLYSEGDDNIEMDSVTVTNERAARLWTVRFADPAVIATYGVEASTRRIVSYEVVSRKTGGRARKVFGKP